MAEEVVHNWDRYVEEAKVADFVLRVDAETSIRVTNPNAIQVIRIAQGYRRGDAEAMLSALSGDQYDEILKLLAGAGHKAMAQLTEDMMEHFGFYEEVILDGPSGGSVRATRPTEIQRLVRLGYTPRGGAQPSSN